MYLDSWPKGTITCQLMDPNTCVKRPAHKWFKQVICAIWKENFNSNKKRSYNMQTWHIIHHNSIQFSLILSLKYHPLVCFYIALFVIGTRIFLAYSTMPMSTIWDSIIYIVNCQHYKDGKYILNKANTSSTIHWKWTN